MVVLLALFGLLLFAGYAGVTGRFAADSRDPEFGLFARDLAPLQQEAHGARQVIARPVVERTEVDGASGDLDGVCLMRQLAG